MNSVALFLLRTTEGREGVAFWLLDALATTVIPGHWEKLAHISMDDAGVVTIRYALPAIRGRRVKHRRVGMLDVLASTFYSCNYLNYRTSYCRVDEHAAMESAIHLLDVTWYCSALQLPWVTDSRLAAMTLLGVIKR